MTCFLLIRHTATDESGRILSGRREGIALNVNGREDAASLPKRLAAMPPDLLCSSPLLRCRETAAPIADAFDLEPRIVTDLQELEYGEWQGRAWADLEHDMSWQHYNQCRSFCRIPGGELLTEVQLRMLRSLETLAQESRGKTIAVVSHGDPIRAVLAYCLGMPLDLINRLVVSTGSVNVVTLGATEARVHCINNTSVLNPADLFA